MTLTFNTNSNNIVDINKDNTNNNPSNNSYYDNKDTVKGGPNSYNIDNTYQYKESTCSNNDDTGKHDLDLDDPNFVRDYYRIF